MPNTFDSYFNFVLQLLFFLRFSHRTIIATKQNFSNEIGEAPDWVSGYCACGMQRNNGQGFIPTDTHMTD